MAFVPIAFPWSVPRASVVPEMSLQLYASPDWTSRLPHNIITYGRPTLTWRLGFQALVSKPIFYPTNKQTNRQIYTQSLIWRWLHHLKTFFFRKKIKFTKIKYFTRKSVIRPHTIFRPRERDSHTQGHCSISHRTIFGWWSHLHMRLCVYICLFVCGIRNWFRDYDL